jgi:hypothetical protein
MVDFTAVTDEQLERARHDPAFRRRLLSNNLEVLLLMLNRMRNTPSMDAAAVRQVREGVDLAVKLVDLLQAAKTEHEPPRAA